MNIQNQDADKKKDLETPQHFPVGFAFEEGVTSSLGFDTSKVNKIDGFDEYAKTK